jgi:hypothetical protein
MGRIITNAAEAKAEIEIQQGSLMLAQRLRTRRLLLTFLLVGSG